MNDSKKILGDNLRRLADEKGISRRDLGERLGVPYTTVCEWFAGRAWPRADTLDAMAEVLSVSVPDLVSDANDRPDAMDFALFGAMRELSEADRKDVLEYIRFKKMMKGENDGSSEK